MPVQSRQLSEAGISTVKQAMKLNDWKQQELADELKVSRSTISQLLAGQPVRIETIEELCHLLDIEVGQVLDSTGLGTDIDGLVQRLREQTSAGIEQRCGLMRILDMTQPIDSGAIYTAVNILERITSKTRRDLDELMDCGPEGGDRFLIGKVREKRVDALEAVLDKKQLMILGRPGAGKTTFLKRLAMLCRSGDFLADQVPIFVTLKEWAESSGRLELLEFVGRSFSVSIDSVQAVLMAGRGMVLLDGLDEVLEKDHNRVCTEIRGIAEINKNNQIVVTCRLEAQEYIFEKFTDVQIADFSDEQIQELAGKWFLLRDSTNIDEEGESTTGKIFWNALEEEKTVKELALNPLLLLLLCLEFEGRMRFPKSRADLYESGLDLLFRRWDDQRGVRRESAYGKLSLKRKKSLLEKLAISTFERGDYFFKQHFAERLIDDYIQNLPEAKTDSELLLVDSRDVLRDIVAQHGLLTEQARGIYSFSHLTFHEYFAAQSIIDNSNLVKYDLAVRQLMKHIADKRWREVFLLVVERSDDVNHILTRMKKEIDEILAEDKDAQTFLYWIGRKSSKINATEKPSFVRSFYYVLIYNLIHSPSVTFIRECSPDNNIVFIRTRLTIHGEYYRETNSYSSDLVKDRDLVLLFLLALALSNEEIIDEIFETKTAYYFSLNIEDIFNKISRLGDRDLASSLQGLKNRLPDPEANSDQSKMWWKNKGKNWFYDLAFIMISNRCIVYDWLFDEIQQESLEQYYVANQLLTDCLKSECYADRKLLQHIEDTMFLPIAEIEKRALKSTIPDDIDTSPTLSPLDP